MFFQLRTYPTPLYTLFFPTLPYAPAIYLISRARARVEKTYTTYTNRKKQREKPHKHWVFMGFGGCSFFGKHTPVPTLTTPTNYTDHLMREAVCPPSRKLTASLL